MNSKFTPEIEWSLGKVKRFRRIKITNDGHDVCGPDVYKGLFINDVASFNKT